MLIEDTIEDIIQGREGPRVDFKLDASSPHKIVKDIVAFANTSGGTVIIGIDDSRDVVGLSDLGKAEEVITNTTYTNTEPQLIPSIGYKTHKGKDLLVVDIQYYQGVDPIALRKGGRSVVYERVGS